MDTPKCYSPLDWENEIVCENYSLKNNCDNCKFKRFLIKDLKKIKGE